ncbi:MAG: TetR family transcriptional regulator, partial [Acidimicrobiales bacterium]|nr:TetR family transcriptional regulator [Acidimicrobiales bacterium]
MCSAGDTDPEDGGTPDGDSTEARDRLIDRTIAVVGAEGAAAATVRRIAADVGVSPALVLHHFGSKAGLLEACEARVTARIDEVVAALSEGSSNDAGLQQLLATPGAADAIVYIGRAIGEGSEPGRRWFDLLYDRSRAGLDAMAEAGALRPSDDPT